MIRPLGTIAARIMTQPGMTFPRTLHKLNLLLEDANAPTPVVSSIIASDPALTALILGRANASAPSEPTKVSHAVVVLGTSTVHGLIRGMKPLPTEYHTKVAELWGLANATAAMCRLLGTRSSLSARLSFEEETLHALGLIHDLGSFIAYVLFPDEFHQASQRTINTDCTFSNALQSALGASPALLGSLWAHHLHLPPLVLRTLHHQEQPLLSEEDAHGAMLVHVARNLVKGCGFATSHDPFVEPIQLEVLDRLGLTEEDLHEAINRFFHDIDELELFEGALLYKV